MAPKVTTGAISEAPAAISPSQLWRRCSRMLLIARSIYDVDPIRHLFIHLDPHRHNPQFCVCASFMMLLRSLSRARACAGLYRPVCVRSYAGGSSSSSSDMLIKHATTILCVRKEGKLVMIGDGQVTQGAIIAKPNARKIRRVGRPPVGVAGATKSPSQPGGILVGMAGSTADCFTLIQRLEKKLDEYPGQLTRACVELAKDWRTEKYLRCT